MWVRVWVMMMCVISRVRMRMGEFAMSLLNKFGKADDRRLIENTFMYVYLIWRKWHAKWMGCDHHLLFYV